MGGEASAETPTTKRRPISRPIDEDVGQAKHAYGIDVYHLNGQDATSNSDTVRLTFTSLNSETTFTVLLAVKTGTTWTVTPITPGTPVTVRDIIANESLVFIARGAGGTGVYEMTMAAPPP